MKIPVKSIIFCLILVSNSWAQKSIDPTIEDIAFAKKTREKYIKDDVAILESKEEISFEVNKKDSKVVVNSSLKELLMNINTRADIQKYEFYNGESSIEKFKLTYRNNRDAYFFVKDEYYKDQDLFYNDARVQYMKIDFPVQGYSYNFELEKIYKDIKYFTSIYFNDEFPVLSKEIVIVVPNWLNLELKEFNFEGNKITKTKVDNPRDETTTYTYKMIDIPGVSKEENAPGRSYIYPHIVVIAKSFSLRENQITLFSTTADLYKWYKSLLNQMKDDTSVMKEKVVELTSKAKSDEEKIKNIYYWVQDNIRYIAFEDGIAGFKPDESNNVFTKRYGDCKGMGNLTKQMLKLAGFDARVTWIGTKHIAYDYTTPSLSVDNHMICTLFHKGKKYYLDGTEKYNSFGEYAERIQNKEVMIEDGEKFIIDKVPSSSAEVNKETYKANFTIENEKLVGVCNRTAVGESRSEFLYRFNSFETNKKGETLERYLSNYDKNIQVDNIKTSDLKNRDIKLTMDYSTTISNKVSSFDNDIYVDLDNRKEYKGMELKDRKFNYQFDYKENFESDVTLAIPMGYKVTKLPENFEIKEENFTISIKFEQTPKEIIYKKLFVFKNGEINTKQLTKWNESIKKLNTVYNQQITLSKV